MNRRSVIQAGISIALDQFVHTKDQEESKPLAEQIAQVLMLVQQIRPGNPRSSLLRDWQLDGGLQVPSPTRYLLKLCHSIKIEVSFRRVDVTRPFDNPEDTVTQVSKPYLEFPYYD